MTDVVIAGIGQTEVGEHFDISLRDLALMAMSEAQRDAGGLRPENFVRVPLRHALPRRGVRLEMDPEDGTAEHRPSMAVPAEQGQGDLRPVPDRS